MVCIKCISNYVIIYRRSNTRIFIDLLIEYSMDFQGKNEGILAVAWSSELHLPLVNGSSYLTHLHVSLLRVQPSAHLIIKNCVFQSITYNSIFTSFKTFLFVYLLTLLFSHNVTSPATPALRIQIGAQTEKL